MQPQDNAVRNPAPLNIVHVFRAPVGGLFRHVMDLAREQVARGHHVGIICDSLTGGDVAAGLLADLEPKLKLGLKRFAMPRNASLSDLAVLRRVRQQAAALEAVAPQLIVHGHGSKGGLFARLFGLWPNTAVRAYTPHGGSFNQLGTKLYPLYMGIERMLKHNTDIFLFESAFIEARFWAQAGDPKALSRVVFNGISAAEFEPVTIAANPADFLYLGELRAAKGIDTLIDALAIVHQTTPWRPTATFVGTGPDRDKLIEHVAKAYLTRSVVFAGAMSARQAFTKARTMVVPSRAESLPYVVLEAVGAQIPLISTNVGGIPEIFGPFSDRLIECNDAAILARQLIIALEKPASQYREEARLLATATQTKFLISHMVDAVIAGYCDAMQKKYPGHNAAVTRLQTQSEA